MEAGTEPRFFHALTNYEHTKFLTFIAIENILHERE